MSTINILFSEYFPSQRRVTTSDSDQSVSSPNPSWWKKNNLAAEHQKKYKPLSEFALYQKSIYLFEFSLFLPTTIIEIKLMDIVFNTTALLCVLISFSDLGGINVQNKMVPVPADLSGFKRSEWLLVICWMESKLPSWRILLLWGMSSFTSELDGYSWKSIVRKLWSKMKNNFVQEKKNQIRLLVICTQNSKI